MVVIIYAPRGKAGMPGSEQGGTWQRQQLAVAVAGSARAPAPAPAAEQASMYMSCLTRCGCQRQVKQEACWCSLVGPSCYGCSVPGVAVHVLTDMCLCMLAASFDTVQLLRSVCACVLPFLQEGELRPQLLDRFGMSVNVSTITDVAARTKLVLDRWARGGGAQAAARARFRSLLHRAAIAWQLGWSVMSNCLSSCRRVVQLCKQ